MANKTAFVTGGTGFIGLNLVEHLTQTGWEVVALHRPNSRLTYLQKYPVRLVEGTIEDAASLDRALPENVDAVFHVAGDVSLWSGHRERQWRTNVEGTRNMVATALAKRSQKVRAYVDDRVYGMQTETFDETAPKLGKDSLNYQRSKAAAEDEVAHGIARGLDAVFLNPANVIGRYDWSTWSQVHTPGGQPATVSHSAGTRLLRRCRCGGARASRGRREGTDRAELYSRRGRGLLCRDRADGGQIARSTDQYRGRPGGRVAARRPRLGMDLDDHREGALDIRGIGRDRDGEYRVPKRQGDARARLSARVGRNHAQGLHRLDDRREPHRPGRSPLVRSDSRRRRHAGKWKIG